MARQKSSDLKDFQQFYIQEVEPLLNKEPKYIRLDGGTTGSSRKVFGHFSYLGRRWKVDEDTHIEKLKIAYERSLKDVAPFHISRTKGGENYCLVLDEKSTVKKMMYIYEI
ncbi:hypothetical protein N180_01235 [Pedobacter antarcticus 4BY]|uniref:Uncharacterized protein n=2 Tax=Pedobacter antarcticus TaxID=34086 RepID=A0A081PC63_9SPHI|nr:hypothetical protein [Pedobacter antarcticus]KEQ28286.1 hypothetical protein N180_01235 [Pedobacter antarcticus 4BY]SFE47760.1 hypothetical protein SAMN03003324_00613 [Pedobacter antarcticus]